MCYLQELVSTPDVSILDRFLSNLHILCPAYIAMILHTKFEENRISGLRDIYTFLKIARFSSHFLQASLHQFKTITLSQEKQPSPGWISFIFDTLMRHILAYLHLKLGDV